MSAQAPGGGGGASGADDGGGAGGAQAQSLWDVADKATDEHLKAHGAGIRCVATADDSVFTGSSQPVVRVWQVAEAKVTEARTMKHGAVGSSCVEVDQEERMVAICSDDGSIGLWDTRESKRLFELPATIPTAWKAKFLPGGRRLVSGGPSGTLCFWDLGLRSLVREVGAGGGPPSAAKADGRDAAKRRRVDEAKGDAAADEAKAGTAGPGEQRSQSPVYSLAVSTDGRYLACGRGSGAVSVLRLPSEGRSEWLGDVSAHWDASVSPVRALAFDPGCRLVLSGGDDSHVCLLDAAAWGRNRRPGDVARAPQLERFSAHRGWVTSVSACPDKGRHIALSTSWDSTVKLWDYRTHTPLRLYKEHSDSVSGGAFAPRNGRFFVTVGADAQLVLYTASTSALVARG